MFVYGCNRVIRYLSLLNHTAVLYDTKGILENLGINQKELREICVLSGTDYNFIANDNTNTESSLYATLNYFKKYNKEKSNYDFYTWMIQNTDYIKDYELLKKITSIFDLTSYNDNLKILKKIKIVNGPIIKNEIKEILKTDGFIFL